MRMEKSGENNTDLKNFDHFIIRPRYFFTSSDNFPCLLLLGLYCDHSLNIITFVSSIEVDLTWQSW